MEVQALLQHQFGSHFISSHFEDFDIRNKLKLQHSTSSNSRKEKQEEREIKMSTNMYYMAKTYYQLTEVPHNSMAFVRNNWPKKLCLGLNELHIHGSIAVAAVSPRGVLLAHIPAEQVPLEHRERMMKNFMGVVLLNEAFHHHKLYFVVVHPADSHVDAVRQQNLVITNQLRRLPRRRVKFVPYDANPISISNPNPNPEVGTATTTPNANPEVGTATTTPEVGTATATPNPNPEVDTATATPKVVPWQGKGEVVIFLQGSNTMVTVEDDPLPHWSEYQVLNQVVV